MAPHSKSKCVPVEKPPVVEEEIEIGYVSDSTQDEETPNPAPAKTQATRVDGANAPGNKTTRVTPVIKPVVKSNRALDIDLIFNRRKGEPSVCKYCK
jgi:hypothetical protein